MTNRPVSIPYDVAVIGGGASGLAAAIASARKGARTCVLERDVEAGLPILATGNGRCNVSNAHLDPARYRHPAAAARVMGTAPERAVERFFERLGMLMAEEGEGRLYPVTRRAETVRDVLLRGCRTAGAELRCCSDIVSAMHDANASTWRLNVNAPARPLRPKPGRDGKTALRQLRRTLDSARKVAGDLSARRVIIACGGSVEALAELFALPHAPEQPVLCPIACAPAFEAPSAPDAEQPLAALDGLRVEGALSLLRDGATAWHEAGEVLFRPYGVSGIAAFNLSRRAEPGDILELDLFPQFEDSELAMRLKSREQALGAPSAWGPSWFDGMLAPALAAFLAPMLTRGHVEPDSPCVPAHFLKHVPFLVRGTADARQAQIRRGGIPLDAIDLDTLAVRPDIAPALHVCGEALDMDADCGGYNLAWAWLSGIRAGEAAALAASSPNESERA